MQTLLATLRGKLIVLAFCDRVKTYFKEMKDGTLSYQNDSFVIFDVPTKQQNYLMYCTIDQFLSLNG